MIDFLSMFFKRRIYPVYTKIESKKNTCVFNVW